MKLVIKGIYCFKKNGEIVYVGSSIDILRRQKQHLNSLRKNKNECCRLQQAFNKYGEDLFVFEVLELTDNLIEREQYYIDYYNPRYNIEKVARQRSPETIRKMKESMAARKAAGIQRKRSPMSEETKEKIRNAQKGKPREYAKGVVFSEERRRKISQRLMGNTNGAKKT